MKYTVSIPWIIAYSMGLLRGLWKGPLQASHSRGTKPPRWRAKVALGQHKQKIYIIWNGNFLCSSCPSATFALQHGGFVPRGGLAAKGLLLLSVIKELICGHRTTRCCLFVCYFFFFHILIFQVMFLEWNVIMYVYWTRDVVTEQFALIKLIKTLNFYDV